MKDRIAAIFDALQADAPDESGWIMRRIDPRMQANISAALGMPDRHPSLLFELSAAAVGTVSRLPDCAGFDLKPETVVAGPQGKVRLCLRLKDRAYKEVFLELVSDLVETCGKCSEDAEVARTLLSRLNTWERFLSRYGLTALSENERAGLFAELWFLGTEVLAFATSRAAVDAWLGPKGAAQDFRIGDTVVEIKSSAATVGAPIKISNLDQLSPSHAAELLLAVIRLELGASSGTSLAEMVRRTRHLIAEEDAGAATEFDDRLRDAGYFEAHSRLYENSLFAVDDVRWFRVREGFPSLTTATVPLGVVSARYSISLTACLPYEIDAEAARGIYGAKPHA